MKGLLTSDMGRLQVDFYLVLLIGIWLVAAVLTAALSLPTALRFAREPGRRLAGALVGAVLGVAGLFAIGLGTWAFWGIVHAG